MPPADIEEEQAAVRVDLVVNIMDVVDDCILIAKAMGDAKRAYADYCSAQAMFGLSIDGDTDIY